MKLRNQDREHGLNKYKTFKKHTMTGETILSMVCFIVGIPLLESYIKFPATKSTPFFEDYFVFFL